MSINFKKLKIPDVILIEPESFKDERGYFFENYNSLNFNEHGITTKFVQDNFSYSHKNVLRGLHFQKNPKAQAKLVSVLKGEIFDVAVDLRKNSSTYMKWVSEIQKLSNLSEEKIQRLLRFQDIKQQKSQHMRTLPSKWESNFI